MKNKMKNEVKMFNIWFIEIGFYANGWGICLFDKYCYTSTEGFNVLEESECLTKDESIKINSMLPPNKEGMKDFLKMVDNFESEEDFNKRKEYHRKNPIK